MFSHLTRPNNNVQAPTPRALMLWFLLASLLPFCLHAVPTQWQWAHPTPHGNQHNSVIWGDDEFIAIGEGGNIVSQTGNFESWLAEPSGTTENLNDIAWSGSESRYVSVGDQGTIVSRTSSGNWSIRTSTIDHKLTDVIWNGEQFLAIGEYTISYTDPINGTQSRPAASILTSATGSDWRLETPTLNPDRYSNVPPPRLRGITWDGSLYVASSDDGAILTSADGIAWHTRSINSIAQTIAPTPKQFLAVGDNGLVLSSSDGTSWTKRASGISDNLHDVAWIEGLFVVVGANGTILSTDYSGTTWNTESSESTETLRSITFNETSSVIAVGDNGTILTRNLAGTSWTQVAADVTSADLHSVTWYLNYIAVGSGGTILTSINTTDWQAATNPPAEFFTDLLHVSWHDMSAAIGDEFFLATGKNGTLLTTTSDINTWVPRTSNITDEWLFDSAWDGTNHIVVGSNGTLITSTSLDGSIWTTQNAQTSEHLLSLAIDNTTTLIGGEFNLQIATNDPTDIIPADIIIGSGRITYQHLNDILFANNKYIAIGNAGTIITSDDTYDWTTPSSIIDGNSSITNDLLSIGIENAADKFLITGTWGTFLRSGNSTGDTWTSEAISVDSPPSPSTSFFYGVTSSSPINSGDSIVTIVGSGGNIYTSIDNGTAWNLTAGPLETQETINDLAKSDTLLVAVGDNGTILTSNNRAVEWAQVTASSCGPNRLHAVAWSDVTTRFIAVGEIGTICYSDDGFTWETPPISPNLPDTASTLYGIVWGKDQFIAVGGSAVNSVIYTSPFGNEWTPRNSSEPHTLRDIVWDEDHFVAIGDGGTITTSPKGISWTRNSSGTTINLNSIAVGETTTIVTGTSSSPISTIILRKNSDGTWTGGAGEMTLSNIQINDISAGGTQFTAVAPSGTIMVSSDGIQWRKVLTGTNSLFKTVLWDDSKFIAAGAAAHILYSTNPDLIITGGYTAEEVREGETARIVFTITNKGMNTALATSYSGQFSNNSTFLSSTTTHGSCTMGTELICQFGNLVTDETVTLITDIVTTATGAQGHIGTVSTNEEDSDETNNTRTITLQVSRGNDDGGGAAVSYWWLAGMLITLLASGRNPNDRWRDST